MGGGGGPLFWPLEGTGGAEKKSQTVSQDRHVSIKTSLSVCKLS